MIPLRAVVVLLVVSAVRLDAQQLAKAIRISDDNEYFNFWIPPIDRPDNNYTQGLRVSWPASSVPSFGRTIVCRRVAACGLNIEVGQEMYTPTFDSPAPEPGARPYAGFLYGRFAFRAAERHSSRALTLVVGLTGEPSLAETAQILFHRYFGFRHPQGWKYQLGAEPAFALSAEQAWRIAPGAAGRFVDFVPTVEVLAGTLRTSARAGGRIRIGSNLDHPWLASTVNRHVVVQGFVGGRVERVAHDLFLDGSTFEKSVSVDGEPVRSLWERGFRIGAGRAAFEYSVVSQSREYRTGPAEHTYSSLSVIWLTR